MPVTAEENNKYQVFVQDVVKQLGSFNYEPETPLWHYTNGQGLIGIVESGQLHATQVACLNDSTETLYATNLFKQAVIDLLEKSEEETAKKFLAQVLKFVDPEVDGPAHSPSKFFVTCFSSVKDDIGQWRSYSAAAGAEYGYSLAFKARGLVPPGSSALIKVNYDKELHTKLAEDVAKATLCFYKEGLDVRVGEDAEKWAEEFFTAWDERIYRLAPLIKDEAFALENEFRIVYEIQVTEIPQIRFKQKSTLLARYLPLSFPLWLETRNTGLPLVEAMVGPCDHGRITLISLNTLLRQFGYGNVPASVSKKPLQRV